MTRLLMILILEIILTSCSDEKTTGTSIQYIVGNENSETTNIVLKGSFSLNAKLVPVDIDVDVVDENLKVIDQIETILSKERNGQIVFTSILTDSPSSILRIKYTCAYRDSSSKLMMDFVEYIDVHSNATPVLNLPMAIASKRIEYLVQKDGFYFKSAQEKALRETFSLFDYKKKEIINFEHEANYSEIVFFEHYLDILTLVSKNDSTFYKNYNALSEAIGKEKTWRDILPEAEIADMAFANYTIYTDIWQNTFGLTECDSAHYNDTATVTNKKSAYNKRKFICDINNKNYCWRELYRIEATKGLCSFKRKDTVIYDSLVWICDSAKSNWRVMSEKEGVTYLYGACDREQEGNTFTYNSVKYSCVNEKGYIWKENIPEDYKWNDPVNIYVKKTEGVCDDDSGWGKKAIVNNRYYQCYNRAWTEVDKLTYYLGKCDTSKINTKAKHDSVGYYVCNNRNNPKWAEQLIPIYYGNECSTKFDNYIKRYDSTNFICSCKWGWRCAWNIATDAEVPAPIKKDMLCEKSNEGEVVEIDSIGYKCEYPKWVQAEDYELKVHRAMERNKFPKDYCKDGRINTTIFWDKVDSSLYGCIEKYNRANFGWGEIKWDSRERSVLGKSNLKKMTGGVFSGDYAYSIDVDGWKLTMNCSIYMHNNSTQHFTLHVNNATSPKGVKYELRERYNYIDGIDEIMTVVRAAPGDSSISVNDVQSKSKSFDKYFADWTNKIIESTQCPQSTLPSFKCVNSWEESSIDIQFEHYNDKSHTTWEQAKSFCPEGFRIPSAEEFLKSNYSNVFNTSMGMFVQQKTGENEKGDFAARFNLVWTNTEKDADTQYCLEYVTNTRNNNIVASGIVECPKDLYPMVQVVCINDGRKP